MSVEHVRARVLAIANEVDSLANSHITHSVVRLGELRGEVNAVIMGSVDGEAMEIPARINEAVDRLEGGYLIMIGEVAGGLERYAARL